MDAAGWTASLRALRHRLKTAQATTAERQELLTLGAALGRYLTAAQNLSVPPGLPSRSHFRVSHVFELEVDRRYRAVTHDISHAGFSALVPGQFRQGQEVAFTLGLGRGELPVEGRATVVSSVRWPEDFRSRVSFSAWAFEGAGAERLDLALLDVALTRVR
jgi:hypothetical protein